MQPGAVDFYFDFISPFAYLAWKQIEKFAENHQRPLVIRPVLFAALLDHWGQLGPAEIEPKRIYIMKQVLRRAAELELPLAPPPRHPFNPLLGLRLAAVDGIAEADRRRLIHVLFDATWGGGPGIEDVDAVAAMASGIGLDGRALVDAARSPEGKARVRATTAQAIERGVFGVPTMIADGELFWGVDSLADLGTFLRGADPVDRDKLAAWSSITPSAVRPGSARTK